MAANSPLPVGLTVPYYIFTEKPIFSNSAIDSIPFWFWIVVAAGCFLALLIIVIAFILCCRKKRSCFWCCCNGFDSDSKAPMVAKSPDVVKAANWMATNEGYVPRAQRLSHGYQQQQQQQQLAYIEDLDETQCDDGRRSVYGGTISSSRFPRQSELAVVRVGGSASLMGPARGKMGSAVGQHSASIQVAGGAL